MLSGRKERQTRLHKNEHGYPRTWSPTPSIGMPRCNMSTTMSYLGEEEDRGV